MAEGLFNTLAPAGWAARSAGTDPEAAVRIEAIAVMREIGINIAGHRPKSIAEVLGSETELVIGLCAEEGCPLVPGARRLHWPLPNPAGRDLAFFRGLREDLSRRIRALIDELIGAS